MYNPYSLNDKTILITGASSGIGRSTAIECSKLGARCVITGRDERRLNETLRSLVGDKHIQITADLTCSQDVTDLVSQTPVIDGLVNNAGIAFNKPIPFIKQSDLDNVFSINTFAPVMLTKFLLKSKKINKSGSIVFTSSIAALNEVVGNSIYGMTKAALMSFAKYCSLELADRHIRVNSVHPGMVKTELIDKIVFSEEELREDLKKYPLKRYGEPQDIAWSIIFLLSDASSWITGTQMIIDGGLHLV